MLRLAPLLLLLFAGCQRPVVAVLTYGPIPAAAGDKETGSIDMSQTVLVVQRRIRSCRLPCRASLDDSQHIRIEAFDDDQETLDRIDNIVTDPGTVELRIVANADDHKSLIERAEETEGDEVRDDRDELLGWWAPIAGGVNNAMPVLSDLTTRKVERDGVSGVEVLVVNDPYRVDGSLLETAAPGVDQTGRPNVCFVLTDKGGQMMGGLTSDNLPDAVTGRTRKLAILLNGCVFSAPAIQSAIYQRGEITGDFTEQEVQDLADVLNAGSLPVPLERVNVERVGGDP